MTPPDPAALARALFDRSTDALVLVDPAADRPVGANPAALRLTGFDRAELLALPATQLVRAEAGADGERVRAALAAAAEFPARDGFHLRCKSAPGGWLPVTLGVSRLDPDPLVFVAARADRDRRFRALVETSRDGLVLLDEAGTIGYASPASRVVLGYEPEQLVGRPALAFVHPADAADARARLAEVLARPGEDVPARLRLVAAGGGVRRVEVTAANRLADPSVRAVVAHYRDVTERDGWEAARREARTLEAVGRLAGGIAHDFNNLLTVVLGNLEIVRAGAGPGEAAELLAGADRAARQAADLTRQMLGFARRQPVVSAPLDLNALAADALALIRRSIDPRVEVRFAPAADLPPAAADPAQVQQVLTNLCLNACDAMPGGGVLTVETGRAAALPDRPGPAPAGGFVRLSVSDTGVGMAEEVRARVFEPFFTTKDVGQGTGLGLAVVYGVAAAHGGAVTCASEPGRGARFDLYLPCAAPAPAVRRLPDAPGSGLP